MGKKFHLVPILGTALVTGVVTVLTGLLLFKVEQHEPRLTYTLISSLPFEGSREKLMILQLEYTNDGSSLVRNVSCDFDIGPATIRDHQVLAPKALAVREVTSPSAVTSNVASLNPGERVSLSVLATVPPYTVVHPRIALRGEGVNGKEAEKEKGGLRGSLFSGILPAFAGLLAAALTSLPFLHRGHDVDSEKHKSDQNEVIAYICGLHSLVRDVDEYLRRHDQGSYWSESDRMAALAVASNDPQEAEQRKLVLLDLITYASPTEMSLAIIHYNVARIAVKQGNSEEAERHLNAARSKFPKLIAARVSIDNGLRQATSSH